MKLSELAEDIMDLADTVGDVEIRVSNDIYICILEGKLVFTKEPIGSVIYILSTRTGLH